MPFPRNEEKQTFIRLRLEREPHPGGRSAEKAKKYYGGVYHRLPADVRRREVEEYERRQQEGEEDEESDENNAIEENETAKPEGADETQAENIPEWESATATKSHQDAPKAEDEGIEQQDFGADAGSNTAQSSPAIEERSPKKPATASPESDVSSAAGSVLLEQVKATESNTPDPSAPEAPPSEDDPKFEDPGAEETSGDTTTSPQREDHVSGTAGSGEKDEPSTPDASSAESNDHNADLPKGKPKQASVVSVEDEDTEATSRPETSPRGSVELENEEEEDNGPPEDNKVTDQTSQDDDPFSANSISGTAEEEAIQTPEHQSGQNSDESDDNSIFGPSPVSPRLQDESVLAGRKRSREDEDGDEGGVEGAKVPRIEEDKAEEEEVEEEEEAEAEDDENPTADEDDRPTPRSGTDEDGAVSDDEPVSDEDVEPPAGSSAVEKQTYPYLLNFGVQHHREDGDVSDDDDDDNDSLDLETQIAIAIDGDTDDALEVRDRVAGVATLPGGGRDDDFYYPDPPAAPVAQMAAAATRQGNAEASSDEQRRVDELMSFLVVPEGSPSKREREEESAPPAVEQRPQKRPGLKRPGQRMGGDTSSTSGQQGERRESVDQSDGRADRRASGARTDGAPSLLSYLLDELEGKKRG